MTTTTLHFSDRSTSPIVIPILGNDYSTSVPLTGTNSLRYAEHINQACVSILESFSNSEPPSNPIQGTLWYNNQNQELAVYDSNDWYVLGELYYGTSEPSNTNQLWYDTNESLVKVYNGTQYESVGVQYLHLDGNDIPNNQMSGTLTITGTLHAFGQLILNGTSTFTSAELKHIISNQHIKHSVGGSSYLDLNSNSSDIQLAGDTITLNYNTTGDGRFVIMNGIQPIDSSKVLSFTEGVIDSYLPIDMSTNRITNVIPSADITSLVPRYEVQDLVDTTPQYYTKSGGFIPSLNSKLPNVTPGGFNIHVDGVVEFTPNGSSTTKIESGTNSITIFDNNAPALSVKSTNIANELDFEDNYIRGIATHNNPTSWANKAQTDTIIQSPVGDLSKTRVFAYVNILISNGTVLQQHNVGSVTRTNSNTRYIITYATPSPTQYNCVVVTSAMGYPPSFTSGDGWEFVGDSQFTKTSIVTNTSSTGFSVFVLEDQTQGKWNSGTDDADSNITNRNRRTGAVSGNQTLSIIVYGY